MSMLDVAKCLYFSKSIDLSREKDRYFNLSVANSGHLFPYLNTDKKNRNCVPACVREKAVEEPFSLFGKGK